MPGNKYNPIYCEHKQENKLSAWMFQSEEQGNYPGTGFKVAVYVCANCGEIKVVGRREDNHGRVNYFDEHFDIHHPDAVDAIIKQANFYNEEAKWQRVPPPPASAEEEAARLYPKEIVIGKEHSDRFTFNQLAEIQRLAHITCAGMYTGEIERLTEQNHKLMEENDTISEELGELKNITEGLPARIMNQQRDLLVGYRNKIALIPGITVETILEMLEDDIKTLRTMDGDEIIKNIKK